MSAKVPKTARRLLALAGALSAFAALMHLSIIAGGPSWYRFFGAGEQMARLAERGSVFPTLVTLCIAAVLSVWAAYAFSAAGMIMRLPLIRTVLVLISVTYLARALLVFLPLVNDTGRSALFWVWSSGIVLVYGATYASGTWLAWPSLSERR